METVTLKDFVSVKQVARRYGIPAQQVYRAIRMKKLKARKVGWALLIHKSDLPDKWFDSSAR